MQRISSTSTKATTVPLNLRYVNTAINGSNYLAADPTIFSNVEAEFNRLYSAAFLPTLATLGSDPYNNALIPLLNGSSEWQDTDPTSASGQYNGFASAYGVPVGAENDGNDPSAYEYFSDTSTYNVTIAAAYLSAWCQPMQVVGPDFFLNSTLTLGGSQESTLYLSMTPMSGRTNGSLELASLITLNTTANHSVAIDIKNTDANNFTYAYTNCSFAQVFVDAKVSCKSGQCYTYAIKPTYLPNNTAAIEFTDSGSDNWVTGLLGTSGATSTSSSNIIATDTERYLMNGEVEGTNTRVNLTTVDQASLSYSLSFVMNTFWSIGFAPGNLTYQFYNSTTDPFNKDLGTVPQSWGPGVKIDDHDIYITNWGWFAALQLCSAALLIAGIFSIWWDARTVSPDVLGFASSVVRKSKYVQLPPVASSASGPERARALGDVRVMMQDVKPSAPVGRIALGTFSPNAKRLEAGRSYR